MSNWLLFYASPSSWLNTNHGSILAMSNFGHSIILFVKLFKFVCQIVQRRKTKEQPIVKKRPVHVRMTCLMELMKGFFNLNFPPIGKNESCSRKDEKKRRKQKLRWSNKKSCDNLPTKWVRNLRMYNALWNMLPFQLIILEKIVNWWVCQTQWNQNLAKFILIYTLQAYQTNLIK